MVARTLGLVVVAVAVCVLVGWAMEAEPLKTFWLGGARMKPGAAAALAACGLSLFLTTLSIRLRPLQVGLGLAVSLFGGLFLFEYATGHDLGVDKLLTGAPSEFLNGRPSVPTASSFVAVGLALALMCARANAARMVRSALAVGVILFSLTVMLGYFVSPVDSSVRQVLFFVAFHTAALFFLLSIGVLAAGSQLERSRFLHLGAPILGLLALLALVLTSLANVEVQKRNRAQVSRSNATQIGLLQLLTVLDDAETSQMAFLLTGAEGYLEPYQSARREVDQAIARLGVLTANDGGSGENLARVKTLVDSKLAELRQTIDLKRAGDSAAALAIVNSDAGERAMAPLRAVVAEMKATEERETGIVGASARSQETQLQFTILGAIALVGALAAFLLIDASRRFEEQRRLKLQLVAANARLDGEVAEKTAELRASLRLFVAQSPAAIAIFDRDMRHLATSAPWMNAFGLEESPNGRNHYEVFPELPESLRAVHRRCLAGAEESAEAERFERADGSVQWVKWAVRPWRDSDGEIGGIILFCEDTTKRVKAERALRQSNLSLRESLERFRVALGTSPISVFEQDLELRYNWIYNPKIGLGVEALIGHTAAELLDPAIVAQIDAPKRQAIATASQVRAEVAFPDPGGALHHYEMNVEPRRNAAGDIIGVIGAATDITELKTQEKSLRMSQQRMQLAAETAGIGVWEWNVVEDIIVWDPQMFRLYGIPETEGGFVGYDVWRKALLPEEVERQEADWLRHLRDGDVRRREFRIKRRDNGEIRVIQAVEKCRRNAEDKTEWVLGTNIDITERVKGERALRQSDRRLRQAADAARLVYVEFNRETRWATVAENYEKVMGYDPRTPSQGGSIDNARSGMLEHVAWPDRAAVSAMFDAISAGRGGVAQFRVIGDDGIERWFKGDWSPELSDDGSATRIFATCLDITNVVESRNELAAAKAEAERASEAKSRFLAAASHDMRQPVQSLNLLMAVIRRELADGTQTAQPVQMAQDSIKSLNDMLTGFLDISRLDAGLIQPVMASVDLNEIVGRLAREYQPRAAARGLVLRWRPSDFHARTDAVLQERILRNLIENALRYTSKGGVLIGLRQRGDRIRLDVIDTGNGIPVDKQAEIFEEFRQLDNPARDASKGLGLGLAIVSRLAGLIGGEVEVRSRLGRGTRFSLLLPQERTAPVAVRAREAGDNSGGRILVIEDVATLRHAYEMMLEFSGYEVSSAETGEEALALAAREGWRFDAVIADHRLGAGLTGTETAKEIRRQAGRAIPTVIVTGDTGKERLAEVSASGFAMLHKPVDGEELCDKLAALLASRNTSFTLSDQEPLLRAVP